MHKMIDASGLTALLQSLERDVDSLTPIHKLQDGHLRDWLKMGNVPSVEFIQFTRGLIAPADQEKYIILLGSAMVSSLFELVG